MTYPPRPKWNHPEVKALAALEILDEVREWASSNDIVVDEGDPKEFRALVTLALQESPDAYHASLYMHEFIDWPVDMDLVRIFDRAFNRLKFLKTQLVHEWVMKHNVRFPAKKGQLVLARVGDVEFKAIVKEVISREASSICELQKNEKPIRVHAEEVLRAVDMNNTGKGPGNFPTGGTPVAAEKGRGYVKTQAVA